MVQSSAVVRVRLMTLSDVLRPSMRKEEKKLPKFCPVASGGTAGEVVTHSTNAVSKL